MHEINKIGIIMWGLFGDVLARTPVLKALKNLFPQCHIHCFTDPVGYEILLHSPYCNTLTKIDRNKKNKLNYLYSKISFYIRLKKERFDLFIDLYGSQSSKNYLQAANSRFKIDFDKTLHGFGHNTPKNPSSLPSNIHNIAWFPMFSLAVFDDPYRYDITPVFNPTPIEIDTINQLLRNVLDNNTELYLVNLGSSDEKKMLSIEKYFKLIAFIYESKKKIPAVICNPSQEYLQATLIKDYLENSAIPFIKLPPLSIGEIAALMIKTHFITTPDTGIYHLAIAMDIPVLGLFTYLPPLLVDYNKENVHFCFQKRRTEGDNVYGNGDLELDYLIQETAAFLSKQYR